MTNIPTIQYSDFSREIHQNIWQKGKYAVCQMELTFRCNHRCGYCYIPYEHLRGKFQKDELTYSEICRILDQIYDEGTLWLCLTGGEPFMREDFLDIYTYAKKKGFFITIFTNGGMITPQIVDYLVKYRPFSIEITLNSINKKTFEKISKIPGSYKKTVQGIRMILDNKLPLKLKTKAMTLNYQELGEIKKFVEKLGLKFSYNPYIYPKLDGTIGPFEYRLTVEQILNIEFQDSLEEGEIEDRNKENQEIYRQLENNRLYRCPIATWTFHIDPHGKLFPCSFVRQPSYDLRKGSFKAGYYTLFPQFRTTTFKSNSKCKNCDIFHLCQWCPGKAYLENGNNEMPIEYFCELAHQKASLKSC